MGSLYSHHAPHYRPVHELPPPTKEDPGGPRNGHIDICWLDTYDLQNQVSVDTCTGMIVGLVIRVAPGNMIQDNVSFDYQFFFNLLLPPIILASGYELHQANFFRNIGSILTFAFAGTFISALVLGLILYLWTRIPLDGLHIDFVDAFSVGA